MSDEPVRVLLVDDDDLMRAGLKAVLSSDDAIEVVGEASDGSAAVDQVQELEPAPGALDADAGGFVGLAPGAVVLVLGQQVLGERDAAVQLLRVVRLDERVEPEALGNLHQPRRLAVVEITE